MRKSMAYSHTDRNGYERGSINHSDLIHRQIAYYGVYLPNRRLYPGMFREYQVHHIDGNKRNNAVSNLQLVTREEHKRIHGIGEHSLLEFMGWLILASVVLGFLLLAVIISIRMVWG